jgi:hypothetical protein
MNKSSRIVTLNQARTALNRCNHPIAVLIDPSERELRELEAMLTKCPNCSQWAPGDGPIMAVLTSNPTNFPQEPTKSP